MKIRESKSVNIHLTKDLHGQILSLRELGITLSSVARLAIKKYGSQPIADVDSTLVKAQRVILYLDLNNYDELGKIAAREGRSRADVLRCLMTRYLRENKKALESLI